MVIVGVPVKAYLVFLVVRVKYAKGEFVTDRYQERLGVNCKSNHWKARSKENKDIGIA
jgi:hypothetical protein